MTIHLLRPGQVAQRIGNARLAPPRRPAESLWAVLERTHAELRRLHPGEIARLRHWHAGELADLKAEMLSSGSDLTPEEIVAAAQVEA